MRDGVNRVFDVSSTGLIALGAPDGVHLISTEGSGDRLLKAEKGAPFRAQFSADGKSLYLFRPLAAGMTVVDVASGREGPLVKFETTGEAGSINSVHPDGKRALVATGGRHYDLWMAEVPRK